MKKKLIFLLSLSLITLYAYSPLKTIEPEYEGDSHKFVSLYVSPFKKIYMVDQISNEIYLVDNEGNILNSTGGYGWQAGLFDKPTGLSSPDGLNIYIADYNNQRIAYYDQQLNFLGILPPDQPLEQIFYPLDIAVSKIGKYFILDDENKEILVLDRNNQIIDRFGGLDYGKWSLQEPMRMVLTERETLAVLEQDRILTYSIYGKPVNINLLPDTLQPQAISNKQDYFLITCKKGLYFLSRTSNRSHFVELNQLNNVENSSSAYLTDKMIYLMTQQGQINIFKISDLINLREDCNSKNN